MLIDSVSLRCRGELSLGRVGLGRRDKGLLTVFSDRVGLTCVRAETGSILCFVIDWLVNVVNRILAKPAIRYGTVRCWCTKVREKD